MSTLVHDRRRRGAPALVCACFFACVGSAAAQSAAPFDLMRPPTQERSVVVRRAVPAWLALPSEARVLTSDGLEMRPLRNAAVSYENISLGVLVGALRNAGRCASNVRAWLQYTDDRWQPLGEPIESEARVSQVEPGGLLPYRFRLRHTKDFATAPSGYLVQVVEDGRPIADTLQWVSTKAAPVATPCAPSAVRIDTVVTRAGGTLSGYRVQGELTVATGGPVRADAITLTALLLDKAGDVLEVLVGVPDVGPGASNGLATGARGRFRLRTDVPVGSDVATRQVFVDLLPGATLQP